MYQALMTSPDGRTKRRVKGTAYMGALLSAGWRITDDPSNKLPEGYGVAQEDDEQGPEAPAAEQPKKKRGRPRGSKNGGR